MKMIKQVLLLGGLLLSIGNAEAGKQFLNVEGRKVWVDYVPPKKGMPTLVLLNGLTYQLGHWDSFVEALSERNSNLGILRFDMIGMGETLLSGKLPVRESIPYSDQVELTRSIMDTLRIERAYVAGLSYGGGIAIAFGAAYPQRVEQLILMAPFTEPMKEMDLWIRGQITLNRFTFPLNPATDDELYDFFLKGFVFSTYPSLEPSVLDNQYKLESVFRMIQGIRKYQTLNDARRLPAGSTHLLVASQDQYIKKEVLDRFWNAVPARSRASRIDISVTEHKIPESIPDYAAAWTLEIISRRKELNTGLNFEGDTRSFSANSGSTKILMQKRRR
jgi:pimeloyl-ACP methyl ester carboxylesterase